jgi:signal transduction histidine kinase/DNA-binding NarL/FixJ family response regulator
VSNESKEEQHRVLSELAVRRTSVSLVSALGWVGLTAAAYLGNALHIPLFFNVDLLFGSIFTLIVLHYYGWVPALISSLIGASFTAVLWLHPYAAVVLVVETLVIGLLYRRQSHNLMLLSTVFWVPIGMPLVLLFYAGILDVELATTTVVMLKQAINGIFNALIASLIISILKNFWPNLEPAETRAPFAFAQVIFLMVVAFVLIPAMGILVVSARSEMTRVEQQIQARLSVTSVAAKQGVSAWLSENLHTLGSLAAYARPADAEQMNQLQEEIELLRLSDADFQAISVIDPTGRVVAAEPMELARHSLSGADVARWPYFVRMVNGMEGVVSNAVIRPPSDVPMVLLGVPIIERDVFAGAVVGLLDVDRVREVLDRLTGSWEVSATVIDANGLALATTGTSLVPFSQAHDHLPRADEHVSDNLFIRVPPEQGEGSSLSRWEHTEFMTLDRMSGNADWLLMLGAPTAPYQEMLTASYQTTLFWMMVIIVAVTGLSALISKAMLGSLTRLTSVAERLSTKVTAQKELEWPTSSIGEIQKLISCFRLTSDHLGQSFQHIQETNAELMEAKQEAEAASRAKSQFLANVSHDLRTPLNGILGYAQILSHDSSLDSRTQEAIGIIEKSGNHLLNLINDILDISRIEAQKLELEESSFGLRHFLEDLADIVRVQIRKKGLDFHTDFASDLPDAVTGDEKRIRQILLNLLNNAVKFTQQGSVSFTVSWENGELHAVVSDTGPGIPAAQQEEVFSPFRQLSKHVQGEEGTGLGLAIVDRLVNAMDGRISLTSELGAGSSFTIMLPLEVSSKRPNRPGSLRQIVGYEGDPVSILVVDDKWENRSVARSMLEPLGFTVLEAENGAEGIESISSNEPDLVLMDLVMPILDGFGAIRKLRSEENAEKPAVIAVSASVANTIRQECSRVGFDDFLPKPFERRELLELIHRHTGVQWSYGPDRETDRRTSGTRDSVVPDPTEMEDLLSLVASGNIRQIVHAADQLEQDHPELEEFAGHVRRLAHEFQINQLSDYLTRLHHGTVDSGHSHE